MLVWTVKTELFENALGTRLSGQRSGAEAAFQCGQRNSLKTINVDGEHFIRFHGKSCVFKFIRLSVDVASFIKTDELANETVSV